MEQLSGCRITGCKCDGRVVVMEWGPDDMTETDDSEYESSFDRAYRLYVDSYNYDLPEGMTPKTYNPPPRRNRRRRYEARQKYEVGVKESFNNTSDRVFQADQESPKLEPTVQPMTVADDDIPKPRDQTVDHGRGSITGSDVNMSSDEESNLCDRPVMESETVWDSQDSQDPSDTEYWGNVNLQAMQAMREMTGGDANFSENKYPDIVKKIARMTMMAWAEHDALPVEQQTGCEVPGCQCNGRVVEFMVRGSEDMMETDDSEWEDPVDRDNRSYVMSNNYNLSEGMAPRTYTPPLRRNRRWRYEIQKRSERYITDYFSDTSDEGSRTGENPTSPEQPIQSIMIDDNVYTATLRDDKDTYSQSELTGLT